MNIFRSNKCVAIFAIVNINKFAETSVNIQVQFLLPLSEIILEAKGMFECWITVMTLNCAYLIMCVMNHYVLSLRKTFVQHHLALSSLLYRYLSSVLLSYTFSDIKLF